MLHACHFVHQQRRISAESAVLPARGCNNPACMQDRLPYLWWWQQQQAMATVRQCGHIIILIVKFMGPTWGPSGSARTQVGPMSAPWTLLSGNIPDSKVHGAYMGPIWACQDPGGPYVGPMNFAIWDAPFSLQVSGILSVAHPNNMGHVKGCQLCIYHGLWHRETWRYNMA